MRPTLEPGDPDGRARLEALWGEVTALPEEHRQGFLQAHVGDASLRNELESLLGGAQRAEIFFTALGAVVQEAADELGRVRSGDTSAGTAEPDGSTTSFEVDPLLGQAVGHYRIEASLGTGGMGVVYRALDTRLQRTVALKFLPPHLNDDSRARDRFLTEARAAAALDHPNICNIHEIGGRGELSFIAMAFYHGKTLEQVLEKGPLEPNLALEYATQIARALSAAHRLDIIHRDVKPANVIVTADGIVKLLDFGIASTPDPSSAESSFLPGTIAYMSPEQVASRPLDHRTDLWSLGVVLYEMCSGARPFGGESPTATLRAILREQPASPSLARTDIGPSVVAILDRLLQKEPDDRYPSADALIEDLVACGKPRSITHPARASRLGPASSWRRVLGYGLAAAMLSALILGAPWPPSADDAPVAAVPEGLPPATAPGRRLARETTTNSAARDLFDQGITPARFRNNRDARVSLDLFRQAVRLDPSFAGARAHLAMMFVRIAPADHRTMPLLERLDSAKHHALRAVELDDQLPEAHGLLGAVLVRAYEFAGAEASLQRALELDPGYAVARRWLSQLHVFAGRFDEALEEAQRAWESDPASPDGIVEVARGHLVNGDCARTLEWLERLANVRPTLLWSRAIASQCMAHMGRWEEAIVVLREGVSAGESQMLSSLGEVFARAGRRGPAGSREARLEEAWTILDALSAQSARGEATAYDVATVYAGLGENDLALDWLEKAVQDRSLIFEIMHPEYVALHRHPRFVALMSSIRLAGR